MLWTQEEGVGTEYNIEVSTGETSFAGIAFGFILFHTLTCYWEVGGSFNWI